MRAADVEYDYLNGYPFHDYNTASTGDHYTDAPQQHDRCLATPPADNPVATPGNPQAGLQQAVANAQQNLFPCNVRLCKAAVQGAYSGTIETCTWNGKTKRLDCVDSGAPCTVCSDSSADLCDSNGNVYHPASANHQYSYCQIK